MDIVVRESGEDPSANQTACKNINKDTGDVCAAFQRATPPPNLLTECYITHLDKKVPHRAVTDNWSADCEYVNFPALKGFISSYFDCKIHF